MDNFFTRLDAFMKYKGLNDNKITVQAGIAVGTLGKQRRGGKGLSYESISKILRTYPDLSTEWLITGRGEMLKKDEAEFVDMKTLFGLVDKLAHDVAKIHEKSDLMVTQLEYIRMQVSTLQEENKRLSAQLNVDLSKREW